MNLFRRTARTTKCKTCESEKGQSWDTWIAHLSNRQYLNPALLKRAAEDGCRVCSILRGGIQSFQSLSLPTVGIRTMSVFRDTGVDAQNLGFRVEDLYGSAPHEELSLEFITVPQKPGSPGIEEKTVPPTGHSTDSLLWVQKQLALCSSEHSMCGPQLKGHATEDFANESPPLDSLSASGFEPFLPTRVLDLGKSPKYTLKLWQPSTRQSGRYTCLSHCWGTAQIITTKLGNIDSLKEEIPWDSLPKTFQDAIIFTRKLGIRYIWIDSLCIIQDDKKDWQREAAKMATFYQNSFVTLAGTKSPNGKGGLFCDYLQPNPTPIFHGSDDVGWQFRVYVRPRIPHWSDRGLNLSSTRGKYIGASYPLLTRAWVYQERLLAPRVVHFCNTELVWECMETSTCQCGSFVPLPRSNPKKTHSQLISGHWARIVEKEEDTLSPHYIYVERSSHRSLDDLNIFQNGSSYEFIPRSASFARKQIQLHWRNIIMVYTELGLTYDSDCLPALAGLAELAQSSHSGKYLAGLWEAHLPGALLWFGEAAAKERPKLHKPPSWSWPAIRGTVMFMDDKSAKYLCEVTEVECVPVDDSNPKGEVTSGRLVIRGHVIKANLTFPVSIDDSGNQKYSLRRKDDSGHVSEQPFVADYPLSLPGPDQLSRGQLLLCLTIGIQSFNVRSLVLVCISEENQIYKRVGVLESTRYSADLSRDITPGFPDWKYHEPIERNLASIDLNNHARNLSDPAPPREKHLYCICIEGISKPSVGKIYTEFIASFPSIPKNSFSMLEPAEWDPDIFIILANLSSEEAEEVSTHKLVSSITKTPEDTRIGVGEGEWFLTADEAERKERGEGYFRYFGRKITIV